MAKIFVSYSRADSAFVDQFVQNVRHAFRGKATVWYDNEIHGGADWWQMILSQIQQADLFIYLISNESLESSYCQAEMEEAMRLHKLILPVLIRRTDFTKAPEALRRVLQKTQYIDFSKGTKDTGATINLFAAVRTLLEDVPAEPPAPRSPHPVEEPPVVDKKPPPAAPSSSNKVWPIAGGLLVILAALAAVYFLVLRDTDEKASPTPTTSAAVNLLTEEGTEVALEPTESPTATERPSITPTRTRTPTATPTPTATLELLTQIAMEFTQTKIAGDAFASATAAKWTYTPSHTPTPTYTFTATPDYTQTYEKARDDFAASLTAESWTDTPTATPTNTPTATLTPTPTLTEREKALKRAEEGVSSNAEWIPYSEEINGVEMVLVPKGCFMMGSEEGAEDEKPVHEQCFDEPFWIDKTEVTRAMYQECVEAGMCEAKESNHYSENSNQPINYVKWFQARDYCEWRGARLPTEREWEYAARGPDNLIYPWGNKFAADNVVYGDNSRNITAEVGSRPGGASWVEALDMSGNVWEWVSSIYYDTYPYSEEWENDSDTNSVRGARGGSFYVDENDLLQVSYRLRLSPGLLNFSFGFRCSLSYEGG